MSVPDLAGLVGVAMMLAAYAAAAMGKLDPARAPALLCNLVGACLVLGSLYFKFNLAAAVMEGSWALVALIGLIRLGLQRRRAP